MEDKATLFRRVVLFGIDGGDSDAEKYEYFAATV